MSEKDTTAVPPNPGTEAALALGCLCPVMDNGHGKGWMGGIKDDDGSTIFVYRMDCPVHLTALSTHPENG